MAETPSTMLALGTGAPDFSLKATDRRTVSLSDFSDAKGLVVVFMCNHCPYVKMIRSELSAFANDYCPKGVAFVAISSNDAENYPADSFDKMVNEAHEQGYTFPYLYDETQEVAKAYLAACTPDFFLFDGAQKLVYRGQFDDARPGNNVKPSGKNLRASVDNLLTGNPIPAEQKPSIGCNIKWKPGNAPEYF